jgi:hypothetical protein
MLTKIDYLSYENPLVSNCFFETLVRYSFYFQNSEEFFGFLVQKLFVGIRSKQKSINSQASYQLLRLCEQMQFKTAFVAHVDMIVANCIDSIQQAELNHDIGLGHEETAYLYTVLGVFACNLNYVEEAKRYQILEWAMTRLLK